MKRMAFFCIISSVCLSFSAHAVKRGFYAGAGLGSNISDGRKSGLGARAYVGYNLNEYIGLEAGAAKYAKSRYYGSLNNTPGSFEYSTNALDLVMKAYLPVTEGISVYGIGGAAAVSNTAEFDSSDIPLVGDLIAPHQKRKTHKIRPIYGVGVSYAFPESHITTSVEFTRIQGLGNASHSPNAMPPANMAAITFTYNFD